MLNKEEKQIMSIAFKKDPQLAEKICDLSLEEINKIYDILHEMEIINKQYVPNENDLRMIEFILDKGLDSETAWAASKIFSYGRIQGVRAERARRKGRVC